MNWLTIEIWLLVNVALFILLPPRPTILAWCVRGWVFVRSPVVRITHDWGIATAGFAIWVYLLWALAPAPPAPTREAVAISREYIVDAGAGTTIMPACTASSCFISVGGGGIFTSSSTTSLIITTTGRGACQ